MTSGGLREARERRQGRTRRHHGGRRTRGVAAHRRPERVVRAAEPADRRPVASAVADHEAARGAQRVRIEARAGRRARAHGVEAREAIPAIRVGLARRSGRRWALRFARGFGTASRRGLRRRATGNDDQREAKDNDGAHGWIVPRIRREPRANSFTRVLNLVGVSRTRGRVPGEHAGHSGARPASRRATPAATAERAAWASNRGSFRPSGANVLPRHDACLSDLRARA
jgi:hypothetical protein